MNTSASSVPSAPIVRFAPSPTGHLHVGNIRIALLNRLLATKYRGKFILRLDDTDTERSKEEYAQGIEQSLNWLGIAWDAFFRQTDRLPLYEQAAEYLKAAGRLYPCFESEEELAAKRALALARKKSPVYDRAGLAVTKEQFERALANGKKPYWRFRLSDGAAEWQDLILGHRSIAFSTLSDPVLVRADGSFLYTFTSVVDDLETKITHIIRGEDHVTNTAVQLDIYRALGGKQAGLACAHLPLLTDTDGSKLSKRFASLSLKTMRKDGFEPAAVIAYLSTLGSSKSPEILPLNELAEKFDLHHFSKSQPRFDIHQLLTLNRTVTHHLNFDAVKERLPEGATEAFWLAIRGNIDLLSEAGHWFDVAFGTIAVPDLRQEAAFLQTAADLLPQASSAEQNQAWDETTWRQWTTALASASGRKGKALYKPLRLALTREEHGPELAKLLPVIGYQRTLSRLQTAGGLASSLS